ncbi:hypothetical protein ABZ759_14800 [Streptomyces sp. NPDC047860]|uniref:hypothetical protein n=1 Tax=Streptomyces sp. NPDC047860 TaxID=3155743 RepID=UPI0033E51DCF
MSLLVPFPPRTLAMLHAGDGIAGSGPLLGLQSQACLRPGRPEPAPARRLGLVDERNRLGGVAEPAVAVGKRVHRRGVVQAADLRAGVRQRERQLELVGVDHPQVLETVGELGVGELLLVGRDMGLHAR